MDPAGVTVFDVMVDVGISPAETRPAHDMAAMIVIDSFMVKR
jgi:hypothetical protein